MASSSSSSPTPAAAAPAAATPSTAAKIGRGLAKVLGIDLATPEQKAFRQETTTRGESVYSVGSDAAYIEPEPTAADWIKQKWPSGKQSKSYVASIFPFTSWITRYNWAWAQGDLVAGITVGAVVVPQGMAYAKLAGLSAEFGLYSSFVGVVVYWFFATSKDITIGPVAVMSTLVGNIVASEPDDAAKEALASSLALMAGIIVTALGFLRLGFVVDYIPLPSIAAFMTGSALNIAVGQVPTLMGITGFSTRGATYLVFINILKHLGRSKLDAAMGLTALTMLYILRWTFTSYLAKRYPGHQRIFFFLNTLRTAFVILLYTGISAGVNLHRRDDPAFKILGKVPRGFTHMGVPRLDGEIIGRFSSKLPVTVIVLLIEHIAISKSFGRVNNYTINPSQELIAIGITNIIGPFFGAYPATGSFSRTAIKSKAGVRTPFAGVITGIVVLLSLYALTAVFFYIPQASLAAVIIHSVLDLITSPNTTYKFWRVSPIETIIFFAGVLITIFSSIENGIYATVATSAALLLFRISKARGHFLGKVKVHSVIGDHLVSSSTGSESVLDLVPQPASERRLSTEKRPREYGTVPLQRSIVSEATRNVFLPIDHRDGSNPDIELVQPRPGIFIYRFSEGFLYPNATHYTEHLVSHIFANTRRTTAAYESPNDRPWNDPGPTPKKAAALAEIEAGKPTLKAVILDFSSVNNVDITSIQNLIDVRNQSIGTLRQTASNGILRPSAIVGQNVHCRVLASGIRMKLPERKAGGNQSSRWPRSGIIMILRMETRSWMVMRRPRSGLCRTEVKEAVQRGGEDESCRLGAWDGRSSMWIWRVL